MGSMTYLIGRTLDIIFRLQVVHQTIIKGLGRFGLASKFGVLVARQVTPVFVNESVGRGAIDIL